MQENTLTDRFTNVKHIFYTCVNKKNEKNRHSDEKLQKGREIKSCMRKLDKKSKKKNNEEMKKDTEE